MPAPASSPSARSARRDRERRAGVQAQELGARVPADAERLERLVGPHDVALGAVHEVDLGEARGRPGRRVHVVPAKVAAEAERVRDGEVGEVLVAEGDDLAPGDLVEVGAELCGRVCK